VSRVPSIQLSRSCHLVDCPAPPPASGVIKMHGTESTRTYSPTTRVLRRGLA
jgi:hypothetical protein